MTTMLIDEPRSPSTSRSAASPANSSISPTTSPATERMRGTMAAVRLAFTWLGVRKSLTTNQRAQAAESFGAEGEFLSAGKKLLDTRHPAFKAVTAIRGRMQGYWRGITLPFPEPGIRLIRQQEIAAFNDQLSAFRAELDEAVLALDDHYSELRSAARQRLGCLYDASDYPSSLRGLFAVDWEFPSVEPPPYLQQLNPELYRQECERTQARFDEAVRLAEDAFVGELSRLVTHLSERLTGQEDGRPKIFRDSAVDNLREFFERFAKLNVRSNEQLDELVHQAQRILRGTGAQDLRDNQPLRQRVSAQLADVQSVLDDLLIDRPRRNILRGPQQQEEA